MPRKRDIISEIIDKRRRLGRKTERSQAAINRAIAILQLVNSTKALKAEGPDVRQEIHQHIPVALIGLLEGYVRLVIRDLINAGSPFRDNATALDGLRIDTAAVIRMQAARVSPGDLVAHLVPIASIEDINRHLSAVMGVDFITELRKQPMPPKGSYDITEPDAWEVLSEVFADRHIVCHEFRPQIRRTQKRLRRQWVVVVRFILGTDTYVKAILAR